VKGSLLTCTSQRRPAELCPEASRSIADAIVHVPAPERLADEAVGLLTFARVLGRDQLRRWLDARDLENELLAGCSCELRLVADRDHESAGPADHAVGIVAVEVADIEPARLAGSQDHRQAVDDDAAR